MASDATTPFISVIDAAQRLGINPGSLYRRLNHDLHAEKVLGRYVLTEEWVERIRPRIGRIAL